MSMRLMVFGAKGWIGSQFCQLLETEGVEYVVAQTRPGAQPDVDVENEINQVAPSHIISCIGEPNLQINQH